MKGKNMHSLRKEVDFYILKNSPFYKNGEILWKELNFFRL